MKSEMVLRVCSYQFAGFSCLIESWTCSWQWQPEVAWSRSRSAFSDIETHLLTWSSHIHKDRYGVFFFFGHVSKFGALAVCWCRLHFYQPTLMRKLSRVHRAGDCWECKGHLILPLPIKSSSIVGGVSTQCVFVPLARWDIILCHRVNCSCRY